MVIVDTYQRANVKLRGCAPLSRSVQRLKGARLSARLAVICEHLAYSGTKDRNELLFKPWVALEP